MKKFQLSRRDFLAASMAGAASVVLNKVSAAPVTRRRRPNFLLISCDQLSWNAIRANGCRYVNTPNIDRLAAAGMNFDLSYASQPVCCPARASWVTGLMPSEHRVVGNSAPILTTVPDFGRWLSDRGYEAVHVGKWHVPNRAAKEGFRVISDSYPEGTYSDITLAEGARSYLMSRDRSTPFVMHVGFMNPHDICQMSLMPLIGDKFPYPEIRDQLPPLPENFEAKPDETKLFADKVRNHWTRRGMKPWTELEWRYYRWLYYRYVEMLDNCVGHVLDSLEMSGELDNTLVIFTSDHGEGQGFHGLGLKAYLYDEAVRVPFIAAWPGRIPEGMRNTTDFVSSIDLFSTFCDYADVEAPPVTGQSLRPVFEGLPNDRRNYVVSQCFNYRWPSARMIRTERYKLIRFTEEEPVQLFDMRRDPLETVNLANAPGMDAVIREHLAQLNEFETSLRTCTLPGNSIEQLYREFGEANKNRQPYM